MRTKYNKLTHSYITGSSCTQVFNEDINFFLIKAVCLIRPIDRRARLSSDCRLRYSLGVISGIVYKYNYSLSQFTFTSGLTRLRFRRLTDNPQQYYYYCETLKQSVRNICFLQIRRFSENYHDSATNREVYHTKVCKARLVGAHCTAVGGVIDRPQCGVMHILVARGQWLAADHRSKCDDVISNAHQ